MPEPSDDELAKIRKQWTAPWVSGPDSEFYARRQILFLLGVLDESEQSRAALLREVLAQRLLLDDARPWVKLASGIVYGETQQRCDAVLDAIDARDSGPASLRHKPPQGMDEAVAWKCQRCGEWVTEPPGSDEVCTAAPVSGERE